MLYASKALLIVVRDLCTGQVTQHIGVTYRLRSNCRQTALRHTALVLLRKLDVDPSLRALQRNRTLVCAVWRMDPTSHVWAQQRQLTLNHSRLRGERRDRRHFLGLLLTQQVLRRKPSV